MYKSQTLQEGGIVVQQISDQNLATLWCYDSIILIVVWLTSSWERLTNDSSSRFALIFSVGYCYTSLKKKN